MDPLPGVCVVFVLSKHERGVLVTSAAEPIGSIMKESINTGENTSTESKRQGREVEKRGRESKTGKLRQVSVERKGS